MRKGAKAGRALATLCDLGNQLSEPVTFAQIRAACLQEHGRLNEAAESYRVALRAFPRSKQVKAHLREVEGG